MFIRLTELFLIFALIVGAVYWLIRTYIVLPSKQAEQESSKIDSKAIEKAKVEYLEIRKTWINLSVNASSDMFSSLMSDMAIPEVAKFQKHMVIMNEQYNNLQDSVNIDAVFVQKTLALRSLFDDAVLEVKKRQYSE